MPPAASSCMFLFLGQSQSILTFFSPYKHTLNISTNNTSIIGDVFKERDCKVTWNAHSQMAPECCIFAFVPEFLFLQALTHPFLFI